MLLKKGFKLTESFLQIRASVCPKKGWTRDPGPLKVFNANRGRFLEYWHPKGANILRPLESANWAKDLPVPKILFNSTNSLGRRGKPPVNLLNLFLRLPQNRIEEVGKSSPVQDPPWDKLTCNNPFGQLIKVKNKPKSLLFRRKI